MWWVLSFWAFGGKLDSRGGAASSPRRGGSVAFGAGQPMPRHQAGGPEVRDAQVPETAVTLWPGSAQAATSTPAAAQQPKPADAQEKNGR